MRTVKACIFDLDGTLLDTLTSLWYSANQSLIHEGLEPLPHESFKYYAGDGAETLVRRYLKDTGPAKDAAGRKDIVDPHDPASHEHYYRSFMHWLSIYSDYKVRAFDGIPELLEELKKRGIRLAVFSNKPDREVQKLIRRHFGDSFEVILGNRDDYPKKPDPTGACMIAEKFGVLPEETMYLGDTNTDMQTGKNAGMYTIGVLWGFRGEEELRANNADDIISAPGEVLKLIEQ